MKGIVLLSKIDFMKEQGAAIDYIRVLEYNKFNIWADLTVDIHENANLHDRLICPAVLRGFLSRRSFYGIYVYF